MKRLTVLSFTLMLLVVAFVASARADSLQLKDGRLINGKYLGGTEVSVNLMVNGKIQSYPTSEIVLLEFNHNSTAPVPAQPAPQAAAGSTVTVPAGTQIEVRMVDTVDSKINRVGDKFQVTLEQPLVVNNAMVAHKDATVYGRLVESQQAGQLEGQSELRLELTGITINGKIVPIVTSDYDLAGRSRGKQTAERAGIGAGLGALIGAIAGGGKGAGIGAAAGGGAGAASQIITRGQDVHIPSETVLDFNLAQPFTAPVSGWSTP